MCWLPQWTYCVAAASLIGAAVWFYFISESAAYLAYPAAVAVGVTSAMMVAMSLTFLTDLIGENKVRTECSLLSWQSYVYELDGKR